MSLHDAAIARAMADMLAGQPIDAVSIDARTGMRAALRAVTTGLDECANRIAPIGKRRCATDRHVAEILRERAAFYASLRRHLLNLPGQRT